MLIELLKKSESHTKPALADLVEEIMLETKKRVCFGTTLNNAIKEEFASYVVSER